jgi:hypothetical protein
VAAAVEVNLGAVGDPASSSNHIVRVRGLVDTVVGGAMDLQTELRQGGSALSTPALWNDALTASAQTFTHTLSGAQADAITDYSTLRLLFTATQAAGAAPTFVAASALAVTATNGATFAPAIPTGTNGQDILLLGIFRNDNSAPTAPGGIWNALTAFNGVNSSTTIQSTYWYWAVAAGTIGNATSTTAPTITYGTSTILRGGRMIAIRGAETTSPFGTVTGPATAITRLNNAHQAAGSASATTTTDLTPLETNVLGLVVGINYGVRVTPSISGATGWSAPSLLSTTTGTDATWTLSWKAFTTPTNLDNPTIDFATTTTAGVSTGFLFALKPIANASRARVTWAELQVPVSAVAADTPEIRGRPGGLRGERQMHQLLAT